ncbi:hypothetical protein GCM10011610_04090 [Nocardia rhizosphaerihabitans]|uniref:Uncharacterized protein n=1 Tax=Nocardia rhizosphaerihabitans TaxID=1691570 RepID=A0ABQ2K501_9NOCA|nr:hypothetical protein GCM10011610_04090 [Nocardia rhizosphaerihabitans]
MRDASAGVGRIDRQERGARFGDSPHREHGFRRTRHTDGDDILGADTTLDQQSGPSIRTLVQLAVAQPLPVENNRRSLGIVRNCRRQQCGQRGRWRGGCAGARQQIGSLAGIEDFDHPDRHRRIGGHRLEYPNPPAHQRIDRRRVEQIRGVGDRYRHPATVVVVRQHNPQIERRRRIEQLRRLPIRTLECQQHLEQWMPGLRPLRGEFIHQFFERNVGMLHGIQIDVSGPVEQIGERFIEIDLGPQNQSGSVPPGDRHADRNIGCTAQPGKQDSQRALNHHRQ